MLRTKLFRLRRRRRPSADVEVGGDMGIPDPSVVEFPKPSEIDPLIGTEDPDFKPED